MDYDRDARLRDINDVMKQTKKFANRLQTQDIVSLLKKWL